MRAPGCLLLALAGLVSCVNVPDTYAPPAQRRPVGGLEPQPIGSYVSMSDPRADLYIVKDIAGTTEGGTWRWTNQNPTLQFRLRRKHDLKLRVEYTVAETSFARTGPVSIIFLVNGHTLETVYAPAPGPRVFEKPVPRQWLAGGEEVIVTLSIDKVYVAEADGNRLGFILKSAGFVE